MFNTTPAPIVTIINSGISKKFGYVYTITEKKYGSIKLYSLRGENAEGKKIIRDGSWSLLSNIIGNN